MCATQDFVDFHFHNVRSSAAAALSLTLVLIILPMAVLKIATVFEVGALLTIYGRFADSAENWSDRGCDASIQKLYTQAAAFSILALLMMMAVVSM